MTAADASDPIAFLRGLRATRRFTDEPVSEAAPRDILEVARWSGPSMNRQPWHLVVVRDRAMLRRLAELGTYTKHLAGAALAIAVVMDGREPLDEAYDEGRLDERLFLAAHAHGLGSGIGWYDGAGQAEVKRLLGVPPERTLWTVISIGHPAPDERPRSGPARKPLTETVSYERFGRPGEPSNEAAEG